MILRKSNENELSKIVELSKKAFDTDVLVGGKKMPDHRNMII